MTDRYSALTVVLDHDIRDDDAEGLVDAILRLRGVLSVEGKVSDPLAEHVAWQRFRSEMGRLLLDVLNSGSGE